MNRSLRPSFAVGFCFQTPPRYRAWRVPIAESTPTIASFLGYNAALPDDFLVFGFHIAPSIGDRRRFNIIRS
jgi:hypothetical protein